MDRGVLLSLGSLGAKYSILCAGATTLIVYLGSQIFGYPFGLAALIMLLVSLTVTPLLFARLNAGLQTAETGGEVGFQNMTDSSQYGPDLFSFPGKFQLSFYLIGVAVYSAVGLWIVM